MVTNQVLTIAGAKGGVGKTTTSINLAALLAQNGYTTVAIEMDLQMPNFEDFLDFERAPDDATLADVFAGAANVEDATYEVSDGFSVIPSATDIDRVASLDIGSFPELIEDLRWHFDVVCIDTPAGLSDEARRSLEAGDAAIIVSTPRLASLQNASRTMDFARQHGADIRGFILNKSGTGASPGIDAIAETIDVEVLGHVPEDDAVPHAQDKGRPVVLDAPNSGAAIAYQRLSEIVLEPAESTADSNGGSSNETVAEAGDGGIHSEGQHEESSREDEEQRDESGGHDRSAAEADEATGGTRAMPERDTDTSEPSKSVRPDESDGEDGPEDTAGDSGQEGSLSERIRRLFRSE